MKNLTAQIFYHSHGRCRSCCFKILHCVQDDKPDCLCAVGGRMVCAAPESLPLEGKVAFAKQMTDEVASTRARNIPPPHQSPAATASPRGEAFWWAHHCKKKERSCTKNYLYF